LITYLNKFYSSKKKSQKLLYKKIRNYLKKQENHPLHPFLNNILQGDCLKIKISLPLKLNENDWKKLIESCPFLSFEIFLALKKESETYKSVRSLLMKRIRSLNLKTYQIKNIILIRCFEDNIELFKDKRLTAEIQDFFTLMRQVFLTEKKDKKILGNKKRLKAYLGYLKSLEEKP
jgi:hypothetical protein